MIKSLSGFLSLSALLFLCSCSTKIYTHQQVMQSFHTKDDVVKHFGKPDKRRLVDSTEEWFYFHYTGPTSAKATKPVAMPVKQVQSKPDSISVSNSMSMADTLKAKKAIPADTYIRFIFDTQGNVTGYKSQGVDMGYMKKDSFGTTTLKVLAITGIIILVVGLDVYNNTDVNF